MKKNKMGFTLVELLAAIGIMAIIVSVSLFLYVNNKKTVDEKSVMINEESLLKAANLYTDEFEDEMYWQNEDTSTISCLLIDQVIDKGFLKNIEVTDDYKDKYRIRVTKSSKGVNSYKFVNKTDCVIKDTVAPTLSLMADKYTSEKNWSNSSIRITAKASDKETSIKYYQITDNASIPTSWIELKPTKKEFEKSFDIDANGKTTRYFYVKDEGDNVASQSIDVYIDTIGPKFVSQSGQITESSLPPATYKDDNSGVKTVKYMVNTLNSAPSSTNSSFIEKTNASLQCGTTYYAWSVAVDNAGNDSDVKNLGSYFVKCNTSSGGGGGGHSGGGGGNSCDTVCKMKSNSEKWHETSDPAEKARLHEENVKLASSIGLSEGGNYNSSTGQWSDKNGNKLYTVTNSSKSSSGSGSKSGSSGSGSSSAANIAKSAINSTNPVVKSIVSKITGGGSSSSGSGSSKSSSGSGSSKSSSGSGSKSVSKSSSGKKK